MYMLEGSSRWNINRQREAIDMPDSSKTKIYDLELMDNVNHISKAVLGAEVFPEYMPPGKPTGM